MTRPPLRTLLHPRSWPIGAKLTLDLLLAALVPLGIALWLATAQSRTALERAGEDGMQLLAQSTAARLDQLISDTARAAALLAREDTVRALLDATPEAPRAKGGAAPPAPAQPGASPPPPDPQPAGHDLTLPDTSEADRRLRDYVETNPDFASTILIARNGVCLAATSKSTIGADLSFREYFREAIAGHPHVSEFLVGSTTGQPGIFCSRPVRSGTDATAPPVGVAAIKLRGDRIWEMVDAVRLGEGAIAAIVDANGVVIAIPNRALLYHSLAPLTPEQVASIDPKASYNLDRIESLDLPTLARPAVDASRSGSATFAAPKSAAAGNAGRRMVAGYAAMETRTWKVFVMQPQTEFEAASAALVRKQGQVALVVALLAGGLALVRARSITRPVVELHDAVKRIGEGDLDARAPVRSGDEVGRLAHAFNDMAPKLREAMDLRQSIALAMEVQQSLLPARDPEHSRLEIAGRSRYCEATGGDYYDFVNIAPLGPGSTLIAVGDVMGHGIAAALLMASARAALRTQVTQTGDLGTLMCRVNAVLSADRHERFMTLALAVIDADTGSVRWASAGHDPPIVFHKDSGRFEDLEGGDIPLGIDGDTTYTEFSYSGLRKGDLVVIGTDGIWEAPGPDKSRFGKPRLYDIMRQGVDKPVGEIADALEAALREFRGPISQEDDITFVIVRIK